MNVSKTVRDETLITSLGPEATQSPEIGSANFADAVVTKPWGEEYLLHDMDHCAAWVLNLRQGRSTSLHAHRTKKTSLSVLSGRVEFRTLAGVVELDPRATITIDSGVFHQTKAISSEGATVLELESPNNKSDLVRASDIYGRVGLGYEDNPKDWRARLAEPYFRGPDGLEEFSFTTFVSSVALTFFRLPIERFKDVLGHEAGPRDAIVTGQWCSGVHAPCLESAVGQNSRLIESMTSGDLIEGLGFWTLD